MQRVISFVSAQHQTEYKQHDAEDTGAGEKSIFVIVSGTYLTKPDIQVRDF